MAVSFGTRINDDTNFITEIDLDNETCETTGYIDGQAVDFSGGGGSSDFSTAEVTIINSTAGSLVVPIARIQEAIPPIIPNGLISSYITVNGGETVVVTTLLYKGTGVIACGSESDIFDGYPIATSLTVTSGSATVNFNDDVEVTGDCTITIS